jgi:protoporphyrinogen IX oxidase
MYLYVKALHIVFIVTWFSGLFYIVRLFIYNAEAKDKPEAEKKVLRAQFDMMTRRLWYGITWPSAILTLIFGPWMFYLLNAFPNWLMVKLCFVVGLYAYHLLLHKIFKQQMAGVFTWTSQQLRILNEVATIFLVAIVMLAVVKESLSAVWAIVGLILFIIVLMSAIKIYKMVRTKQ